MPSCMVCADQLRRPVTADDDVRHLVACLYKAINSEQYYNTKKRILLARQEEIRLQLEPLEKVRLMFLICNLFHALQSVIL